jgi:hypothetical protein
MQPEFDPQVAAILDLRHALRKYYWQPDESNGETLLQAERAAREIFHLDPKTGLTEFTIAMRNLDHVYQAYSASEKRIDGISAYPAYPHPIPSAVELAGRTFLAALNFLVKTAPASLPFLAAALAARDGEAPGMPAAGVVVASFSAGLYGAGSAMNTAAGSAYHDLVTSFMDYADRVRSVVKGEDPTLDAAVRAYEEFSAASQNHDAAGIRLLHSSVLQQAVDELTPEQRAVWESISIWDLPEVDSESLAAAVEQETVAATPEQSSRFDHLTQQVNTASKQNAMVASAPSPRSPHRRGTDGGAQGQAVKKVAGV